MQKHNKPSEEPEETVKVFEAWTNLYSFHCTGRGCVQQYYSASSPTHTWPSAAEAGGIKQ